MWNRFACALVLVAMAVTHVHPGLAQDDPRRDNDPIVIPPGQTEVEYSRIEDMPRQLQKAFLGKCGREQSSDLKHLPVRIVRLGAHGRTIALVPCGRMRIGGVAFAFGRWWEPVPISFTVMAHPTGFATSESPGFLEWHPDSLVLTATLQSDTVNCKFPNKFTHTYSYSDHAASFFALTKVEAIADMCGPGGKELSVTLWQTPVWAEQWKQ